jgi:allophanate hydrolase
MMAVKDPVAAAEAAISADHAHADRAMWITRVPDDEIRSTAARLAAEGPRDRPLWGVPFAVKDNIDIAGLPTTAACPGFTYHPPASAPAVQHLIEAGALLIGKTNLDQFATGLVGVRSPFGTPRNVFNADHVPGGSSSGSAVAVAAGIVAFALGTDTAGSGRVPAMFGNVVGLKPTVGGVSNRGMVPACRSIDVISVFARSVDESLAVARVIAGYDAADPYSRTAPPGWLARGALAEGFRVATADIAGLCDDDVTKVYTQACAPFDSEVADLAPFLEIARLLYDGPWVAERTAALREVLELQPEILLPVTRTILATGLERRTVDAFAAFHRLALARRAAENLFAKVDALLLPTAPFCPTLAALAADPIGPNARLGTFTNFVNLCDLAAMSVPAGFSPSGMPIGVTVLGPAWSEGRLAAIADAIHRRATSWVGATKQAVPAAAAIGEPGPEEAALFCIGAHMSGLKLNRQITALGGRFLRESATVAGYRLFALGERPGLLRDATGGAIAGEVWAVPRAAIGALLAQVPAPLGFGEVLLQDGPCLGFLAEAAGVADAIDITTFGGWRAYLASRR